MEPYVITRGKVIFDYSRLYCDSTEQLLKSELFADIVERFIEKIATAGNTYFAFLGQNLKTLKRDEFAEYIINIFRLLSSHTSEEIVLINKDYEGILSKKNYLFEFIEELYNFWRRFERFIYIEAPKSSRYSENSIQHKQFIESNERFRGLVLSTYRRICSNLTGSHPRVYRQLPSGTNMGMLIEQIDWDCPDEFYSIRDIPFITLTLLEPPLIIYPKMNTRKGKFEELKNFSSDMIKLNPTQWYCFPSKIGELTAFIYFHQDFISLGLSLSNLFELADYSEIDKKRPDILLLFGVDGNAISSSSNTVFYEDKKSDMLIGLVKHSEDIDYFGYFKKMPLTLHNIAMLKRGRLPVHGAMAYIKMNNGLSSNILIIGDSGAGKSETIEALRTLLGEDICEMIIIFDDMGSLGIDADDCILGYGTEVGAFVRLDDLQHGYAYEEIDRSIFMNPDKTNARLIMPITHYYNIIKGYPIDMVLYANNYELVNDELPAIEFFNNPEEAISVFRTGARFAKGTTDELGLVKTYFANPFGAPQRREIHEAIAVKYFTKMFEDGIRVGQIRTRLGVPGFSQTGPQTVAVELLKLLKAKEK
ncbi:MAG: phosphoenolpyruvate carboxykinase [Nitrospirae bacterium]|nr:phosphoenolpyruvate carboxykinase [Nitrospirota bacterium]